MIRLDQGEEEKKTDLSDRRKKSHFKVASRIMPLDLRLFAKLRSVTLAARRVKPLFVS